MTVIGTSLPPPASERTSGGLLLVGPQAQRTGALVAAQVHCPMRTADSLLEAVLLSGEGSGLILMDAGPEADHLAAGLPSLRRVNPGARIVLLCEPIEESLCRQACQWGADDYEILPVTAACVGQLAPYATATAPTMKLTPAPADRLAAPAAPTPANGSDAGRLAPAVADLPAIPLIVQTEILEEILAGSSGEADAPRQDFAQRAAARLARLLASHGVLTFAAPPGVGEAETARPGEWRRPVSYPGQAPFGTLIWQPSTTSPGGADAGMLAQAAHWLGTMLALSQRYEQLRVMAITDELSGAYNRRYFMSYMNALLERSRENRSRVTLLLFDIDDFKRYNDTYGHGSGDAIIRELIKLLRACTRPKDLVARVGGDEFAVVYWDNEPPRQPNSEHPKEIIAATERFREAIRIHQWPETCRIKGTISISGGLASFPWDADTLESLMAKADEALLQAKGAGKNVILLHNSAAGRMPRAAAPQ